MLGAVTYNRGAAHAANSSLTAANPPKIKCNRCNVVKTFTAFSKRQLDELAMYMARNKSFDPVKGSYVPCIGCTTRQVNELTCHICDKTKALSGFSKAQRRTPDKAICWKCAEEKQEYEPGENDDDVDEDDSDVTSDDDSDFEGFLSTGASGLSIDDSSSTYPSHSGGGVSLGGVQDSTNASTACGSTTKSSVTSTAVPTSSGAWNSTQKVTQGRKPQASNAGSKWAKPPKAPARNQGQKYDSSDEDDVEIDSDSD